MIAHLLRVDWRTCALIFACYLVWASGLYLYHSPLWWAALPVMAIATAFHTSLQHETLHGHPTSSPVLNEALVFLPLVMVFPYRRYKALHLQHHRDEHLTDPYEDPESYFWPEQDVTTMPRWVKLVFAANNCLIGRLVLGPALSIIGFAKTEMRRLIANEPHVRMSWLLHVLGLLPVFAILWAANMPLWVYLIGVVYPAISFTSLRSFAEHQAAEHVGARTAVVEAHPFFGLLYLNNNLHIVHHASPATPWHQIPALYRERRAQYLAANENTLFSGYFDILLRFGFRTKQPVAHPIMHRISASADSNKNHKSG